MENSSSFRPRKEEERSQGTTSFTVVKAVKRAIKHGNLQKLKRVLDNFTAEQRCNLFQQEGLQQSLHKAYDFRRYDMMEYLLVVAPSLVDEVNNKGKTVLYRAVCRPWPKVVRLLLKHGADIQKTETIMRKSTCGFTSLAYKAVKRHSLETVRLMVEAGSDIESVDFNGDDALELSASSEDWDIFEYLVEKFGKLHPMSNPAVIAFRYEEMKLFQRLWKDWKNEPGARETLFLEGITNAYRREKDMLKLVSSEGTLQDNIFVREIVGAELIRYGELQQAIEIWKEAMRLRWKDACLPVMKIPAQTDLSEILQAVEVQTLEDVERLPLDHTSLWTQALLVMQRHLPKNHGRLMLYFDGLASAHLQKGEVQEALTVLHEAAKTCSHYTHLNCVIRIFHEAMQTSLEPLPFKCPYPLLQASIRGLQVWMTDENYDTCRTHHLDESMKNGESCSHHDKVLMWELSFVETLSLLLTLEESATPEEKAGLETDVKTFLLLASSRVKAGIFHSNFEIEKLFDSSVLKYLVACSEDLAQEGKTSSPLHLARDWNKKTPLHVYAASFSRKELLEDGILGDFLGSGADLCTPDRSGETIADILVKRGILSEGEVLPSLQCLAAREAAKLPTDLLPDNQAIRDFVSKH